MTRVEDWKKAALGGQLAFGVVLALTPWLIGFAASAGAMWSHVVLGVLVAIAAAIELRQAYQPGRIAHA